MASLDSILNVLVPLIIFVFVIFIFASPFKSQLGSFWEWIKEQINGKEEEAGTNDPMVPSNIIYER